MGTTEKVRILEKPTDNQIKEILTRISDLYTRPEFVIYEYIQNSIDSALELRDTYGQKVLPRKILIHIDHAKRRYVIQDDCEGMSNNELRNLPKKVFESSKKKSPWITGEFGYGIQSYRSWFDEIVISAKARDNKIANNIAFDQDVEAKLGTDVEFLDFGAIYPLKGMGLNHSRSSGTDIAINGIKKKIRKSSFDLIAQNLIRLIPIHFEDSIENKIVEIYIYEWQRRQGKFFPRVSKIKSLDLTKIPGDEVTGKISDKNGDILASYLFKIVEPTFLNKNPEVKDYRPRLSRLGTEIGKITNLDSLRDFSKDDNIELTIWERPELIGKINIERKIRLAIDRTDLSPSPESEQLYSEILKLTHILQQKFEELDKRKVEEHEESLSEIISDVFSDLSKELDADVFARKRKIKSSDGLTTSEIDSGIGFIAGEKDIHDNGKSHGDETVQIDKQTEGGIESNISDTGGSAPTEKDTQTETQYKEVKQRGLAVEFKPLGETYQPSDIWMGKMIVINTEHPFYKERLNEHKDKIISKRFIAYLAIATTPWFLDQYYENSGITFESKEKNQKIVEIMARVEKLLWDKRDLIKKKVAEVEEVV